MADLTINAVTTISYAGSGNPQFAQTNLGSLRIAQAEAAGVEMARTGRSFVGGMTAVAAGLVPVVDFPASTAISYVLYNSQPASTIVKCLVIKRVSAFFCSSTINAPASGFAIFGGVPPSVSLSTGIPTANQTNFKTQATRGYGTPLGILSTTQTIPAATCWTVFCGATNLTVAATTGPSCTADLSNTPFVVQPGFSFAFGVMGSTVGTPLYGISIAWDECEMSIP